MNLLTIIFCFSTFLMTSTLLTNIYLEIDKKSAADQKSFEELIIKTNRNFNKKFKNNGIGTIFGISMMLILSLIFNFLLLKLKAEHFEIKYRSEIYICMKKYIDSNSTYINFINKTNIALKALTVANASGILSPEAKTSIEMIKLTQEINYLQYIQKIETINQCSFMNKLILLNSLPFERVSTFSFSRNIDQSVKLKDLSWKIILGQTITGIRRKKDFRLILTSNLKNNFTAKPIYTLSENLVSELLN
jgi:hypothetical protein